MTLDPKVIIDGSTCTVLLAPGSDGLKIAGLTPEQAVTVKEALLCAFRRGAREALRTIARQTDDLERSYE